MIDVEQTLRTEMDKMISVNAAPDWAGVVDGSGLARERVRRRKRRVAVAAAVLAAGVVALATPLGAAIARSLDEFSVWLTGEPGAPVSEREQREFEQANARSWLGFPPGTQLRRLESRRIGDATVELLGFRAGETLCLRVVVRAPRLGQAQSCAPLRELQTDGSPVRVLVTDHGFGRGAESAWYGVDLVRAPKLRVTAGIAADGVETVEFVDERGTHLVEPASNAVLHVVADPEPVQRVRAIRVRTPAGIDDVPFAPAVYGVGMPPSSKLPVPGPAKPELRMRGGAIGWLDRREPRGEPLEVIPPRQRSHLAQNTEFGRVLTPAPGTPLRVALTISSGPRDRAPRTPLRGPPRGVCTWLLMRSGGGGGCAPHENVFARGPLNISLSLSGGTQAFMIAAGLASDDVARIGAFLANGERIDVPLRDNVFAIQLARSKLPGRLVAFDNEGVSIGVSEPLRDFSDRAQPARGRARSLARARGATGSTFELLIGPSTAGGVCMFTRHRSKQSNGIGTQCTPPDWRREPVQLTTSGQPVEFVYGRVDARTRRLVIRYADGASARVAVLRGGFVLFTVPANRLVPARQPLAADAYDARGHKLGTMSLRPPR